MNGQQYIDLFDVIDSKLAEDPRHCCSHYYVEWEKEVAKPALEQLGYTAVTFSDGERDSFGPLTRIVTVTKNGERKYLIYG